MPEPGDTAFQEAIMVQIITHYRLQTIHEAALTNLLLLLQVCSYRCIASHETPQFEAFSLCILQKHNCLGLSVQIPSRPSPSPMTSFRGEPLSHASAEQLFIGWLGILPAILPSCLCQNHIFLEMLY